jgi:uncharacterized protein (DUF1501 family)
MKPFFILWGLLAAAAAQAETPSELHVLVIIELAGGNDGLNAVVPYADPVYVQARPTLALPKDHILAINPSLGFNPSFQPLWPSWIAGDFGVVLGVGYPHPNRSHFRSIAIWSSASASDQVVETGWLQRWVQAGGRQPDLIADALVLGETDPGPLAGPGMHLLSFDNLDAFLRDAATLDDTPETGAAAKSILSVQDDIRTAAQTLSTLKPQIQEPTQPFPDTPLGRQLKLVDQLVVAGARIPIYKLTLRGFDTHSDELAVQNKLLQTLADAVAAFRASLKTQHRWDDVTVMTESEFGRRVSENGSGGTDHGTAAPVFLWGGRVRGGLIGTQPLMTDLDQGDLKATADFRDVFRAVATGIWPKAPTSAVQAAFPVQGATFDLINNDTDTCETKE